MSAPRGPWRAVGLAIAALALTATSWAACNLSHDALPGAACENDLDCFKGVERCNLTTETCEPTTDAAPVPDGPLVPDGSLPDAELPDADLADAELPDADLPDAELPDAA